MNIIQRFKDSKIQRLSLIRRVARILLWSMHRGEGGRTSLQIGYSSVVCDEYCGVDGQVYRQDTPTEYVMNIVVSTDRTPTEYVMNIVVWTQVYR
jgi:hypothetical protein